MFKKAAIAAALLVAALSSPTAYGWADAAQSFGRNEKGVLQIGTTEPANIQARVGESREDIISYPGAQYIAVRFDAFDLPAGDEVVIRSPDFSVLYTYRGKGRNDAGSFFATHVLGDKVVVQYIARNKEAAAGQRLAYAIPAFARGFQPRPTESVCGKDDSEPAKCYATSNTDLPLAYTRAQAVARLLINGTSLCTGWLAGSEGHLFTNEHCIDNPSLAASTDIEFNAESASCAEQCQVQLGCKGTVVTTKSTFVTNSVERDYAVLKLPATADIQKYGFPAAARERPDARRAHLHPAAPGGQRQAHRRQGGRRLARQDRAGRRRAQLRLQPGRLQRRHAGRLVGFAGARGRRQPRRLAAPLRRLQQPGRRHHGRDQRPQGQEHRDQGPRGRQRTHADAVAGADRHACAHDDPSADAQPDHRQAHTQAHDRQADAQAYDRQAHAQAHDAQAKRVLWPLVQRVRGLERLLLELVAWRVPPVQLLVGETVHQWTTAFLTRFTQRKQSCKPFFLV
ncbi:hypothetical protein PINS_up010141 [Pythium insidiosum]|nr:hypothetical protein PINS_up010141 [Pythium insidiosum]